MELNFARLLNYWEFFVSGLIMTICLTVFTVLIGTIIGFFVALMNLSKNRIFNKIAEIYISIIRGTPLLLQLLLLYYGFPLIGITLPSISFIPDSRAIFSGIIALSLNSGAYVSEIFRGGINSVNKGQSEASRSLGFNENQTMRYIIIPQALKTVLPALGNEFVVMIKESAIVSTIGLRDIMYSAQLVKAATYSIFESLIVVGVIYWILTTFTSSLLKKFERRLQHD